MNDVQLISDYLANDLSEQEISSIESRLETDATFAALLKEHQDQVMMLRAAQRATMKAELKTELYPESAQAYPAKKVRRLWMLGAVAAAAACLLLLWTVIWNAPSDESRLEEQLVAMAQAKMEPYPLLAQRGEEEEVDSLEMAAYAFYRNADYEAALPLFEKMAERDSLNEPVNIMYLGDCLSQLERYEEAYEAYWVVINYHPAHKDAAEWRMGLLLLSQKYYKDADRIFTEIANSSHYKADEAKEFLNLLDLYFKEANPAIR